jgi:hypothetical protein
VTAHARLQAPREPAIREALAQHLAATLDPGTALVHELAIKHGAYRVDLCAITHELRGYEIKSDQDTLARLPAQAKQFSLVFQRMTLVIGPALLASALAIVPDWWGIWLVTREASGETVFSELRAGGPNPKPNYRWVARLLWRDELTACLKARGVRGFSKLKYWQVANLVLETLAPEELVAHVAAVLRERKGGLGPLEVCEDEEPETPPEVWEPWQTGEAWQDAGLGEGRDPYAGWEQTDYSYWDDQHLA